MAALLALRAAAGGDAAAVPARIGDVGRAERRALAAMLAERRHVEEEALRFSDGNLVELLLSLPIFDVHGGSDEDAPDCIGLSVKEHWLAPAETDDALLDERFVRCSGSDEEGLLRFAGVRQLGRAAFLLDHVFPRLDSLPETTRDGCLLSALHSLHALSAEDGRFRPALTGLRFVPTASGGLRCPSELFHPDVSEARELLDADDAFPHARLLMRGSPFSSG